MHIHTYEHVFAVGSLSISAAVFITVPIALVIIIDDAEALLALPQSIINVFLLL